MWGQTVERLHQEEGMPITSACRLFGRTRQSYYKQKIDYREQRERELRIIASVGELRQKLKRIGEFIAFYNEKRPHMSLGMQTPAEVHACQTGAQRRCWKTYRRRFPSDVIESSTV